MIQRIACWAQRELKAAPVLRVHIAHDQSVLLHALHNAGRVGLGAKHQVAQVYVVYPRMIVDVHQRVKAGNRKVKTIKESLLVVIDVKENCFQRFVKNHAFRCHFLAD